MQAMGLQGPLLHPFRDASDVELATRPLDEGNALARVRVTDMRLREKLTGIGLVAAFIGPSVLIVYVVLDAWQKSPQNRSWLILGLGFYIGTALKVIYEALLRAHNRLYLRIEIARMKTATLFDAVSEALAKESELSGATCSWDVEARQEHDEVTGELSVRFRFWGSRPRSLNICVALADDRSRMLPLHVEYDPGTDIMCSRSARLQSQANIVLTTRTSPNRALSDKTFLRKWLEESCRKWVRPVDGVVKIYALQQASSEWTPEWKLERIKPCKNAQGTGQSFYLQRASLQRLLIDARLWVNKTLRVYMVSGPPGVGKSEFIIWLASQLGLPLYRVSLSSSSLTDNLLTQLLSQSSISESPVLVQIDEFQETAQRWLNPTNESPGGVTEGGFCECVQGATAMRCGVVILSGTPEISEAAFQQKLTAVYRRFNCTVALTYMTEEDIGVYFKQFLRQYVPGASDADWLGWTNAFQENGPWAGTRSISIDMLKQFLMSRITDATVLGIGQVASGTAADFRVPRERRAAFFVHICDRPSALGFLDAYARVGSPRPR